MSLTDHELAVVADQLRERTSLPEHVVRRMLFAARPEQVEGEVCSLCKVDLSVRPVMREVRNGHQPRVANATFQKPVHAKPRQVVVDLRREGSFDLEPAPPLEPVTHLTFRFCSACVRNMLGVSAAENEGGQSAPHLEGGT